MGVKLKNISIQNFRGARDLIDLGFGDDCKSCVIFGQNGEGKSSFTQALEWFYKNKIAFLKGEDIEDADIINLASSDTDETSVCLTFDKKELTSSKIFDKANRRHQYSNTSSEFEQYHQNAGNDRLYLDQHTIVWFLLLTKGNKKSEIAKIVGYEEVVKIKGIISSVVRDLERSPRLSEIQRNLSNNEGVMTRDIYGEAVKSLEDLFSKSQTLLKDFEIEEDAKDIHHLEELIQKAFKLLPSQERARERVELERLNEKLEKLKPEIDIVDEVVALVRDFNNLIKDKDKLSKINLDSFLRQAETVLKDTPDIDTCPLCEKHIDDKDALLRSVIERYRKLEEIRRKLSDLQTSFSRFISKLQELLRELEDVKNTFSGKKIDYDEDVVEKYIKGIESLKTLLENNFSEKTSIDLEGTQAKQDATDMGNALDKLKPKLSEKIASLSITEQEEKRQVSYRKLTRGKELVLENIAYQKEIEAFKLLSDNMRKIEAEMLELQNSTLRDVLEILSDDVNKFYYALNKKEKVTNARLDIKGEEGIEFALEFYGREASPPKKYLSESQLNSLGIAFFLAAVKHFNKTNDFFVLDDVLVSFDKNYRLRLLDLLDEEFSDYQIILLTHEEYWYQMARRKFPSWVFKEVKWSFGAGIRFLDQKDDLLERIAERHKTGEKVGNDLRIYVESLLKDICEVLEVKLAFKSGSENERRMIGELFPALTSSLNKHRCPVKDATEYKDLQVSNFITTVTSHDNPDLDSSGDTEETIDKIRKFRSLFFCPKGSAVERSREIPGKDQISCKCGCLIIDWKQ